MDQREHREELQQDLYVLPVVGGAILGFITAEWIGISGVSGTLVGAFVVDAVWGLRGTRRLLKESEDLVGLARNMWEKQKSQRSTREDALDKKDPSQPLSDEEPDDGEIYPSA